MTATRSSAVQVRSTLIASASRVYSSTMLASLSRREVRSLVEHEIDRPHMTGTGGAQPLLLSRAYPAARLRVLTGRLRPSWRQIRRVRLRLIVQPSRNRIWCAVFQPQR